MQADRLGLFPLAVLGRRLVNGSVGCCASAAWRPSSRREVPRSAQGRNETITLSVNATDGRLVAGLVGSTSYGWLLIKMLWVADELRRQGYGRAHVLNAFNHAKSLGCHSAWLDTSNRDAMQFYRALEFTVFGIIENSGPQEPAGHQRWFLKCPIRSMNGDLRIV